MDDNTLDDAASPEAGRPRRAPPTIDLEASEVTSATASGGDKGGDKRSSWLSSTALHPFWVAAVTGAVTAVLVIAVAWAVGWPAETARPVVATDAGAIETLSSRLAELEGRVSKPAVPDPASRLDALEKSLASLRTDVAGARAQSGKLANDIEAIKSAPPASVASPAPPDLTAIEGRLAEVERAVRAEGERIAQATSQPADDVALRRLVVASMLDLSVRQSEPFTDALKAAKALASDPQMLKPLEDFAGSGVPNPAALCRELLTLVPKLEPPATASATTGTGIVERLQAGAAKLVRVERTDAVGNDRGAIVARITTAALRNDVSEARRELMSLNPADRASAQGWLDKAAERDAALAAAHHFAAEAMAALAKPTP
ncbi:COG4223 family protein [Bradyrhizobium sp.]|jgi:hypothetical protein|uniref:COG4223 family protein n=1 Tax=Bradyrhizobium sp. TaxID=376 RepID=UPI003C2A3CF8